MTRKIKLTLPEGWKMRRGLDSVEAVLMENGVQTASVDVTVGEMPPETTAEDEAMYNYMDMVGFDGEDDTAQIVSWKFLGKRGYGFEALAEDETTVRVMCAEPVPGTLVIVTLNAADDKAIRELATLVGNNLTIE